MTKSSIKKLSLTRRVVASSGIAAALFAVGPVAVAMADDSPSGASSGTGQGDSGSSSAGSDDGPGVGIGSGTEESSGEDTQPGETDSGDTDSGSGATDSAPSDDGEPSAGDPESADVGAATLETADSDASSESQPEESATPTVEPQAAPESATPPSATEVSTAVADEPAEAGGDPTESDDGQPRAKHRAHTPRHLLAQAIGAASTVAGGVAQSGEIAQAVEDETPTITAAPQRTSGLLGSVITVLGGDPGKQGLILLNQGAAAVAVLNRRNRGDGSDYFGLFGPGERLLLPKATVAELVLGKHTTADEVENFDIDEAQSSGALATALDASLRTVAASLLGVTEDDQYWQPSDSDVATNGIYPDDAVGVYDSDVYYTFDSDERTLTIHNDTDHDIGVVVFTGDAGSQETPEDSEFAVVGAQSAYTITVPEGKAALVTVQDSRVAEGEDAGKARLFGVLGAGEINGAGTPFAVSSIDPIQGDAVGPLGGGAWYGLDPDDQYWTPNEAPTGLELGYAPGLHYGYAADNNTITFTNDSDTTVAIIAYDEAVQPVGDGLYELAPGESVTIPGGAGGAPAAYIVQKPKTPDGALVIVGAVIVEDGQAASESSLGGIKTDEEWALDPDDIFWDFTEGGYTGNPWPDNAVGANGAQDGVYYTRDGDTITIHNDSDADIAVATRTAQGSSSVSNGFTVIGAGSSADFTVESGTQTYLVVQKAKATDGAEAGKPAVYGVLYDYHLPTGTHQFTSWDPIAGDSVPGLVDGYWLTADPDDVYWTPGDPEKTIKYGYTDIPRFGERGTLDGAGVTYSQDPESGDLTITNTGDTPIGVINYHGGDAQSLTVIEAGQSATFGNSNVLETGTPNTYVVQQPREGESAVLIGRIVVGSGAYSVDGTSIPSNSAPVGSAYNGFLNSYDAEADDVTVTVTQQPQHGTVSISPGTSANGIYYLYTYTYTPDPDAAHAAAASQTQVTDTFIVTLTDEYGASSEVPVTVVIAPQNSAPITGVLPVTGGATGSLGVTDADGDDLTYEVATAPEHGSVTVDSAGIYTYTPTTTPDHGDTLTDSFTVAVDDGHGGTVVVPVSVSITGGNSAPTAVVTGQDGYTGTISVADADGDTLTQTVTTEPAHGTVQLGPDGGFTYTPNAGVEHGAAGGGATTDSFVVTVDDGHGGTTAVTVNIAINEVNTPPSAGVVVDPGSPYGGHLSAEDADDDELTYTLTGSPTHGEVQVGSDGSFTYTPDSGVEHAAAGGGASTDSFVVTVDDGHGGITPVTVNIAITPTNSAPTDPGPVLSGLTGSVDSTDTDGDTLQYAVTTAPAHGSVIVNTDGSYVYTPTAPLQHGETLSDSFVISVDDGHGGVTPVTVHVADVGPNTAPTGSVVGDGGYTGGIVGADADSDELTYTVADQPEHGTVVLGPDGSYTYTPNEGVGHAAAAGGAVSDSFTVTVADGYGGTTEVTVPIIIVAENSPVSASATVAGGATGSIVATDADSDPLAYEIIGQPEHGSVWVGPDGAYTYTPADEVAAGTTLTDTFVVTVDDGHGSTQDVTVTVTITGPDVEEPSSNFFAQLVKAISDGFSSAAATITAAWQSFLAWLQSLFSTTTTAGDSTITTSQ